MSGRRNSHHIQELWSNGVHVENKFAPNYIPKFTTPEKFINAKVEMLREHLLIELSDEDIEYLRRFKTEAQINAAVKTVINKYWP